MKKLAKTVVFMSAIILLQQGILFLGRTTYKYEKQVIEQNNMEPSVFFYTESEHALEAEKTVRESVNEN